MAKVEQQRTAPFSEKEEKLKKRKYMYQRKTRERDNEGLISAKMKRSLTF